MKRSIVIAMSAVLLVGVVAGLFVVAARSGWLNPSETTLREKYTTVHSHFVAINGEPIHYVDEGNGYPIVLIHGSLGSVAMWNDWAAALAPRYRVIRFDRSPMGLSGPNPAGRYGLDRELDLIGELTARLGIKRFFLVATSSGGESGAAYAAIHPEQIRGLILSNIATGRVHLDPTRYPWRFRLALWLDPIFGGWHSPEFWRGVLRLNFADPDKVTPALVTQWTELNNRAQGIKRLPPPASYVPFARTPADLRRITAPTLLLWSDHDAEVPLAHDGQTAFGLLTVKDKALRVVAGCGHMITIECGVASARAASIFIDRVAATPELSGPHSTE